MFKYFPHTDRDLREMLAVIGVKSLDELYAEVPEELKLHRELNLPDALSEHEVRERVQGLADLNEQLVCFAGSGVYDHYTSAMVPYLASRSEFSTSYTPYQAEISQGTLQYIFEYQTMMARLTGMDVSNASMYDGCTATAEAMLMMVASAKKRNRVAVSETLNPDVRRVVKTYAKYHGVELTFIPAKNGVTDREMLNAELTKGDLAGVIVAQPNYYGITEDFTGLADECHAQKTLLAINSVASTLAVLKSQGEWGADIACGDAQSLGIPMSYGGPYIGYLCTKNELIRKMPGRLVGQTEDVDGKRCFVLTMQAREQHIRREKATSNICTAQGVMCFYVACYLSLMGTKGLVEVNRQSAAAAHYMHDKLVEIQGVTDAFEGQEYLNEFTVKVDTDVHTLQTVMAFEGWQCGVKTEGADNLLTLAVTEKRSKEEIDAFVEDFKEVLTSEEE